MRNIIVYSPENGVDTSYKDERGVWWGVGETDPTYWMPLPDPPSDSDGGEG